MSLESIKKLILDEAQKEAQKIIDEAGLQYNLKVEEATKKAKQQGEVLRLEQQKKVDSIMVAGQAQAKKIIKASELAALHDALDKAIDHACETLIKDKEYLQKTTEFMRQNKSGKVVLGAKVSQVAEIANEAKRLGGFEVAGDDYAIACPSASFIDEFDIKKEIAKIADECADELITKLTAAR